MTHSFICIELETNCYNVMFQVSVAPSESTDSVEVGEESQALSESQGQQVQIHVCQSGSTHNVQ